MRTVILAMFEAPSEAEWAFLEILQIGANPRDVTVFALRTIENPGSPADDGRLSAAEDVPIHEHAPGALPETPDLPPAEYLPTFVTPMGEVPAEEGEFLQPEHPGDLIGRLKELGVGEAVAAVVRDVVMEGGAVLSVNTPTGGIDDFRAWEIIERCGGRGMAVSGPYLA